MDINILKIYELQNVGKGLVTNIDPTNLLEIYDIEKLTLWKKSNGISSLIPYFSQSEANGNFSLAQGAQTIANGDYSHAEGFQSIALGVFSHAEGVSTTASSSSSHAQGNNTIASGDSSHAEGNTTIAGGTGSHAEGYFTKANGDYSHAEGAYTQGNGYTSHAEGNATISSGNGSHSEGSQTQAIGDYSHAEGYFSQSIGIYSHAEGYFSVASGSGSHSEGTNTQAIGENSHAGGKQTLANGIASFVHGSGSTVNGNYSIVLGRGITGNIADTTYVDNLNIKTVPIGTSVNNLGIDSSGRVVVGSSGGSETILYWSAGTGTDAIATVNGLNIASGSFSLAQGISTTASGNYSHSEGVTTTADGEASHSEGSFTIASGNSSHAGGFQTTANGTYSFIHGFNSEVNGDYSIVLGRDITGDTADTTYVDNLNIKTVPIGVSINNLGIDASGRVVVGSSGGSGGTVNDATSSVKGILRLTGDLGGTANAPTTPTALHITGNESFSGQKSTINTSTGFDNGLWLKNTGGLGGYSMLIENTNAGSGGNIQNTGVGSGLLIFNQSTGHGIQLANQSTGRGIFVTNSSTGRGIDVTNTSSGSGIRTINSSPNGRGFTSENSFSGNGIYSLNTSSGNGIYSQNQDTGNGIVSNSIFTSTGGFNFVGQNDGTNTFTVDKLGVITAFSYVKTGGLSTQMLMADGSVKENQDNLQKEITSNYTLVNQDNNHTIFINNGTNPITITLNTTITTPNFGVGFIQEGTGDVTFVGTGVSLTNPIGLKSKGQGESTYIERKLNTSTYYLLGDTKA